MKRQIDWAEIYKTDFIYAHRCWDTCNSTCCKSPHGKYFKFLPQKSLELLFFPGEYDYFISIGGFNNLKPKPKHRLFKMPDGNQISLWSINCNCQGACEPSASRPLICRIYPYIPIINDDGIIEGFDFANVAEIFYENPQVNHPCTLVRQNNAELQDILKKRMAILLKYPAIVYFFKAYKILADSLRKALVKNLDNLQNEEEIKEFFQCYEWNVFTGAPFKDDQTVRKLIDEYMKMSSVCSKQGLCENFE